MFRVSHEFSFNLITNGSHTVSFVGQMMFQSETLNEYASLYSEDEMQHFGVAINQMVGLPEYWTLEILAKSLFERLKPKFQNLSAVNISIKDAPYRVAEYSYGGSLIRTEETDIQLLETVG